MRIVVDLTPVLPGGQNGGSKPLVLRLLRDVIALAPSVEFVLLTSYMTDAELACLDADNARRLCVVQPVLAAQKATAPATTQVRFRRRVRLRLTRMLPPRLMLGIERAYLASTGHRPKRTNMLTALGANLLFSPFTAPAFHESGVPSVSLVHDVEFLSYPRSFSAEERASRHRELIRAVRLSDRVVSTSAFVQRTIQDKTDVSPARLVTIAPRTLRCPPGVVKEELEHVLASLGLRRDGFLLYPGNFKPHKNHGMLLTAFGLYRARHPDSNLCLVCPGEPGAPYAELQHTTRAMGLQARVLFPGFVSDTELAALYQTCRAVIFPSLYEGLGLPVVEAVAFQKPVLCAPHASLHDVAGEAALYFDPRLLSDIAGAIERVANDPGRIQCAARARAADLAALGDPTRTAEDFLRLFWDVAR
jgi:glycosyltransferase involved in cell wall biosynthesis